MEHAHNIHKETSNRLCNLCSMPEVITTHMLTPHKKLLCIFSSLHMPQQSVPMPQVWSGADSYSCYYHQPTLDTTKMLPYTALHDPLCIGPQYPNGNLDTASKLVYTDPNQKHISHTRIRHYCWTRARMQAGGGLPMPGAGVAHQTC